MANKVLSLRMPQLKILRHALKEGKIRLDEAKEVGGYRQKQSAWAGIIALEETGLLEETEKNVYEPTMMAEKLFIIKNKKK